MGDKEKDEQLQEWLRRMVNVPEPVYIDEISEHFEKLFAVKREDYRVFHEMLSDTIHVDVHYFRATEERPFQVLFTTGMSDLPMTPPEDASPEYRKANERGELYCILPADWKLDDNKDEEQCERYFWIIKALKMAARYPHMCNTWLGSMHTLQYTDDNAPFSPYTKLSSAIFMSLNKDDLDGKYGDDLGGFYAKDGTYINLLCLVPLYEEEMKFKLEHGAGELCMRLFGKEISDFKQLEIDNNRKNVCI